MNNFFNSNTWHYRLARTIVQGIFAVFIQYLADILGLFHMKPEIVVIVTPLIMAILSPIMSELSGADSEMIDGSEYKGGDDIEH